MPQTRFSRMMSMFVGGGLITWVVCAAVSDRNSYIRDVEKKAGFRLRQPSFLPKDFQLDPNSPTAGQIRGAIWRYERADGLAFIGVAQEKRSLGRDKYNRGLFQGDRVPGEGYMTAGLLDKIDQTFVYREFDDVAVILTSHSASAKDLIKIAASMK